MTTQTKLHLTEAQLEVIRNQPVMFHKGRKVVVRPDPPQPKLMAAIINQMFRHGLPEGWGQKI